MDFAHSRKAASASSRSKTPSSTVSSSNRYLLIAVKVLLVLVILLWLPPLVIGKRRRKKPSESRRMLPRVAQWIKNARHECETDPEFCGSLIPEESMNCIHECLSESCFKQIYGSMPLEDGEIDLERAERFEECLRLETKDMIREARQKQLEDRPLYRWGQRVAPEQDTKDEAL